MLAHGIHSLLTTTRPRPVQFRFLMTCSHPLSDVHNIANHPIHWHAEINLKFRNCDLHVQIIDRVLVAF